jgi:hypothetical protein
MIRTPFALPDAGGAVRVSGWPPPGRGGVTAWQRDYAVFAVFLVRDFGIESGAPAWSAMPVAGRMGRSAIIPETVPRKKPRFFYAKAE